ncbi:MAG: ABC-F family ATP-binding cassette domain-containing protein [Spirochaetaceae bacterium]|nr:ABC-F family ATP-binding cassette domain-containing protein [Spirochaetaceae bacterium]
MAFVQFSKVSLAFGDRDILKNVSVNLSAGTKAALTGANGSGKSTLMKVMAGLMECDSGDRAVQKDCRIGYLPQSGIVHHGCTLLEEADRAFSYGYSLHNEMEDIGAKLAEDPNSPGAMALLDRQHEIITWLEDSGWNRRDVLARQTLEGLGFKPEDMNRSVEEFSGGWQMRIALAKVLLEKPDILLLDEPTNYLDIEARDWLEKFLHDYTGGFLLVSHDRYFLDVTINEVYELFNGDLKRYPGNYTHYEKVRAVELQTLMARYEQQQEEIHKLEDFIRRFGYKATKAAQAQERQKMLDKILAEKVEIPETLKKIHFSFPPAPHSGRLVLTAEHIGKTYRAEAGSSNPAVAGGSQGAEHEVLRDLNLVVENGDRLVVVGRNGAGKTTLLRILAGQDTDFTGSFRLGAGVSVGYFSQDNAETMNGSQSMLEMLESEAPLELIPKLRDMLGAFLFRGDDVYKSIDVLSGGEKSRLALLRLLLRPVNLLILDEPTNHLDMHSKDVLLSALRDFGGTVIFVSHDRGFIESLATRVLELTPCHSREFPGTYGYYMEQLEKEALRQGDESGAAGSRGGASGIGANGAKSAGAKTAGATANSPVGAAAVSDGAASWEEQKRLKGERRKLEKEEERLMNEISALEEKKSQLEYQLSLPAVYSDGAKSRKIQQEIEETAAAIEKTTAQWEEVSAQLG